MKSAGKLEIILGLLTVVTGFTYVIGLFGPTEAEVSTWGLLAACLGGFMIYFGINKGKRVDFIKVIFAFILLLIQFPAVFLWFMFHGSSIADGTPPSNFTAHWIYAAPHIAIVLLGLTVLIVTFKKNTA